MAKLIQDVSHANTKLTNEELIATLYIRGVTIGDIFSRYFEYDAHETARNDELFGNDEEGQHGRLTVGDAQLAGHTTLPNKPIERQPF